MQNTFTHSPGGNRHPEYILKYMEKFQRLYPHLPAPQVWDKRNGWVQFRGRSVRRSYIEALTHDDPY